MNKTVISIFSGALLLSVCIWLAFPARDLANTGFPKRACSRVFLPAAGRPVVHRIEKCGQDGLPAQAEVEFANGNFEVIKLRSDRTASESVEYFPGPKDSQPQTRRVRSRATFDKDGVTYLTHQVYRLDGTLERSGRGQKDGRYETSYYYADGKTPSRIRQFWNKKLASEKRFREDGSLLASLIVERGEVSISLYSPGGARIANLVRSPMGVFGGDVFSDDGNTLIASFIRDNWNFQEYYFDARGKRVQVRMGAIMFGNVTVGVYDKDEKVAYIQLFRKRPKRGKLPEELILSRVNEYDQAQKITRIIQMNNEGTRPFSIAEPEGDGRIVSDLDDTNGRVLKRTHYNKAGEVVKTEAGRRFKTPRIEAVRLKDLPHIEMPTYADADAPPYVYDYR